MSDKGWIKLHRQLMNNELWTGSKFSPGQAWVDLLLMASHEDTEIFFDGKIMEIKRGQVLTSIRKLSTRWQWSKNKTEQFLGTLIRTGMIKKKSTTKRTLLSLINYGFFQGCEDTNEDTKKDNVQDSNEDTNRPHSIITKEIKESNKKNNIPPTLEEVEAYAEERNSSVDTERFFNFYSDRGWKDSNGKPVKDWKAKFREVWEKNTYGKGKQGTTGSKGQDISGNDSGQRSLYGDSDSVLFG